MRHEVHLFTIVEVPEGMRHPVLHWPGYGIVSPSLVTTNGDWRLIVDSCRRGEWAIEPALLTPTNVGAMSEELAMYCFAYIANKIAAWPPTPEDIDRTRRALLEGPERERFLREIARVLS